MGGYIRNLNILLFRGTPNMDANNSPFSRNVIKRLFFT